MFPAALVYSTPLSSTKLLSIPFSSKSHLALSHSTPSSSSAVPRGFTITAEANKGAQFRRNPKSNSDFSSNSNSKPAKDELSSEISSLLHKINASIKGKSASQPKERSMDGTKKQFQEPKAKDKKAFRDTRSSELASYFDILITDDSNKAAAPAPPSDIRSSELPSYFDTLIRGDSNKATAPAPPSDYKPSRPISKFMRRSPIPVSNPAKEETKTIPKEQLPSVTVREAPIQEMSGSVEMQDIMELENYSKSEPELELKSELEAMTISQLRDIAKAQGLKGYSKFKKAKLVEILKGTSL